MGCSGSRAWVVVPALILLTIAVPYFTSRYEVPPISGISERVPGSVASSPRARNHFEGGVPSFSQGRGVPGGNWGGSRGRDLIDPERLKELRQQLRPLQVTALVFYGRRERFKILNSYLERNLVSAGGILHEVLLYLNTKTAEDIEFFKKIMACHPNVYSYTVTSEPNMLTVYRSLPRDRLFVKIDDDIVYIHEGTLEALVAAKLQRSELAVVSANVVNHPILSFVHSHLGALMPFAPAVQTREWCPPGHPFDNCTREGLRLPPCKAADCEWALIRGPDGAPAPLDNLTVSWIGERGCYWTDWRCAAVAHNSFLRRWEEGSLATFDFPSWDFSFPDFTAQWSINFFAFNSSFVPGPPPTNATEHSDEVILGIFEPLRQRRHCAAVGETLVVHFGYYPQNAWLELYTNLLQKYAHVAKQELTYHRNSIYNTSKACAHLYTF
eukprot:jgi/Botrbrau1/82/Bobra.0022s0072.1